MKQLNRNFLWMGAANLVSSFFSIIIFIYLARTLGAESFGNFSYAMALVLYLWSLMDLGLATYGTREIAKDHSKLCEYVNNILSFKLIAAFLIFAILSIGTAFIPKPLAIKILICESALTLIVLALATEWVFQGVEKMHMVFLSFAGTMSLQLALTFIFIKGPSDLLKAPIVNAVSYIPIIVLFLRRLKFNPALFRPDFAKIKTYLSASIAIGAISIFAQAYNGLDIVILGLFRPPDEVGYFTVARRMIGGIALLLVFLANALLPHLSSAYGRDAGRFHEGTRKFLKIGIFIILVFFLPIMLFSTQIIAFTVGPAYASAGAPLLIMLAALMLVIFNLPYSTGLIAAGFERSVLLQVIASALLSIFSNFILIPKYGMIGAACSFFFAEVLALVWILAVYQRKIHKKEE